MSRVFFRQELEGVATFWRMHRRDGVTLGFTAHDRDLWFDGVRHRAAPGMVPSAIRRTSDLDEDSAEVQGALSHDAISASDLSSGRFDGARVCMGVVDWETGERATLYRGDIGTVSDEANGFSAGLRSAKSLLEADPIPRTSPTCRAQFCGPGCALSANRFTHEAMLAAVDIDFNRASFSGAITASTMLDGRLRWLDGPQAGLTLHIIGVEGDWLVFDRPLAGELAPGTRALLRQGCDHTISTCASRFGNAANFQGEPFLPGNDMLSRYGQTAK